MLDARRVRAAVRRALGLGCRRPCGRSGGCSSATPDHRGCRDPTRGGRGRASAPTEERARERRPRSDSRGGLRASRTSTRRCCIAGRRVVPDLRWPEQRLILEVDSTAWHANPSPGRTTASARRCSRHRGETVPRVALARRRPPTRRAPIAALRAAGAPVRLSDVSLATPGNDPPLARSPARPGGPGPACARSASAAPRSGRGRCRARGRRPCS